MIKKVILSIVIVFVILVGGICGYFFLVDIESRIPDGYEEQIKVETNRFMGRKVFTISLKDSEKSNNVILYFHGGAYVAEATDKHWDFLKKLVKDTKSTVIMPDYPLTPKYTYKDVLNMVEGVYKDTLTKINNEKLIVMGDSAGGGIALGLVEKLSNNNIALPQKTILISPWLDISMSNNKIDEVQKNDKDLNKGKLSFAGMIYSRDLNKEDEYFVSPIKGNLSKLKNVYIYTGTYDILNPDCHLLKEKAKEVGVDIEIKEYGTAPHIWIVNNNDDLAKKAYQDLIEVVNQ